MACRWPLLLLHLQRECDQQQAWIAEFLPALLCQLDRRVWLLLLQGSNQSFQISFGMLVFVQQLAIDGDHLLLPIQLPSQFAQGAPVAVRCLLCLRLGLFQYLVGTLQIATDIQQAGNGQRPFRGQPVVAGQQAVALQGRIVGAGALLQLCCQQQQLWVAAGAITLR